MATSPPRLARRTRSSSSSSRSGAIRACRSKRGAPSRATTKRATCSSFSARPRCRTATATRLARMLGRARDKVQLHEGHVGGGFGVRGEIYPEDVLVCLAALRLGRPVKWIEDRRENLVAANHSRQQHHRVRAAVDARGPHPRHGGRVLPRPGRICAHPRRARSRHDVGHAARPLSHPCVPLGRALPPHQQDAGGDLSRAGAVRKQLRARAPDRRYRRAARARRVRGAAAQPHRRRSDAVRARPRRARRQRGL